MPPPWKQGLSKVALDKAGYKTLIFWGGTLGGDRLTSHALWLLRQNHLEVFRNLIRNLVPTWDKRLCTRSFFHGRFRMHEASYTKKRLAQRMQRCMIYCFWWWFQRFVILPLLGLGKCSNWTDILQMGWNHQLVVSSKVIKPQVCFLNVMFDPAGKSFTFYAPEKWWLEDEFPFGIAYF